jgi:hypothetical protein
MDQTTLLIILAGLAVIVILGLVLSLSRRRRRSDELRESFGPEYDRAVRETGNRDRAEAALEERRRRAREFKIRSLEPEERERFAQSWSTAQARFVDEPTQAVRVADALVTELLQTRGYPISAFPQRADDLSVSYPHIVERYRSARTIALANERGDATTEELRRAMVHYRALFEELLERESTEPMQRSA